MLSSILLCICLCLFLFTCLLTFVFAVFCRSCTCRPTFARWFKVELKLKVEIRIRAAVDVTLGQFTTGKALP